MRVRAQLERVLELDAWLRGYGVGPDLK